MNGGNSATGKLLVESTGLRLMQPPRSVSALLRPALACTSVSASVLSSSIRFSLTSVGTNFPGRVTSFRAVANRVFVSEE